MANGVGFSPNLNYMQQFDIERAKLAPGKGSRELGRKLGVSEKIMKIEQERQAKELEELVQRLMDEAASKGLFGGKLGNIFGLSPLLDKLGLDKLKKFKTPGMFASSIIEGLSSARQKKYLKELSKSPEFAKYKGTYLASAARQGQRLMEQTASDISPALLALTKYVKNYGKDVALSKGLEKIGRENIADLGEIGEWTPFEDLAPFEDFKPIEGLKEWSPFENLKDKTPLKDFFKNLGEKANPFENLRDKWEERKWKPFSNL